MFEASWWDADVILRTRLDCLKIKVRSKAINRVKITRLCDVIVRLKREALYNDVRYMTRLKIEDSFDKQKKKLIVSKNFAAIASTFTQY